jgi:acetyl esterase/lipase
LYRSQLSLLKPFVDKCPLSVVRKTQDSIGRLVTNSYKSQVKIKRLKVGSINCALLTPSEDLSGGIILYLHGGGYVGGNLDYAVGFGSMLAAKCRIPVLAVEYRLAPEHPYPAALDDAMDAYGYLLSGGYEPSRIVLSGESAGAGLCYALCQKLRDKGRTMPAGIIAISPWTDLTMSSESHELNRKADPSLTKERLEYFTDCYVYGARCENGKYYPNTNSDKDEDKEIKRQPRISPLFDTKEKMPESLIFVGGDEILYDDAVLMHRGLLDAGCRASLLLRPSFGTATFCTIFPREREILIKFRNSFVESFPCARSLHGWNSTMRRRSSRLQEAVHGVIFSVFHLL